VLLDLQVQRSFGAAAESHSRAMKVPLSLQYIAHSWDRYQFNIHVEYVPDITVGSNCGQCGVTRIPCLAWQSKARLPRNNSSRNIEYLLSCYGRDSTKKNRVLKILLFVPGSQAFPTREIWYAAARYVRLTTLRRPCITPNLLTNSLFRFKLHVNHRLVPNKRCNRICPKP